MLPYVYAYRMADAIRVLLTVAFLAAMTVVVGATVASVFRKR